MNLHDSFSVMYGDIHRNNGSEAGVRMLQQLKFVLKRLYYNSTESVRIVLH